MSSGYPRIAVLATDNYIEGAPIFRSVEDVIERILASCSINGVEQIRAIECLALFNQLGADEDLSHELDFVAENFARQTGDEMYEHLVYASKHHLVDHRGKYFVLQLLPITIFLGTRRLDFLRINAILDFIRDESISLILKLAFLNQLRHFDNSKTASALAKRLLNWDGLFGSLEQLNTNLGLHCLNALVHVDPDRVADTIRFTYGELSLDDLKEKVTDNQILLQVLEKLIFRKRSFFIAAQLLMKLAASEYEDNKKIAINLFKQLFQVRLSGTEAEPSDRFMILDQGLSSSDRRLISVCVEALANTLKQSGFSRSRSANQIGSQPPLKDWSPKTWGEIFDFHKNGLRRIDSLRSKHREFSARCENIISTSIRTLLCEYLLDDVKEILYKISNEKGVWPEAIKEICDWLYFEGAEVPHDFSQKVRNLLDTLMPTDPIQLALLYTKFWEADLRNPDLIYNKDDFSTKDFDYSSRKAAEIATEIALDKKLANLAIQMMIQEELNNVSSFTDELALGLEDPIMAFQFAVNEFEKSTEKKGIRFLLGLLSGINKRDVNAGSQCIQIASKSDALKNQIGSLYRAVNISVERLNEIVLHLKEGKISVAEYAYFSYGQGLSQLRAEDILPLIDELTSSHDNEGLWVALEIIFMYQLNRNEFNALIAERVKQIITSPKLFESIERASRNGHQIEQLVLLIQKAYGIDDEFAAALGNQVIRLCQVEDYQIFFTLDSIFQKIISLLVREKPILLWNIVSHFFEIATPLEIHNLEILIGSSQYNFNEESRDQEGSLFGIPNIEYINWAKDNPEIRAPFLCIFYPLIEVNELGKPKWHPSLEELTNEFGAVQEFREALKRRFHPSSWSGNIIPYLEKCLMLIKTWFNHALPEMSLWAREVGHSLEREIDRERGR